MMGEDIRNPLHPGGYPYHLGAKDKGMMQVYNIKVFQPQQARKEGRVADPKQGWQATNFEFV
jgi:hypothetical protein